MVTLYLSRRNLLCLLAKLDRVQQGEYDSATIVKRDIDHKVYPQSHRVIAVQAISDEEYYAEREPGRTSESLVSH